jgi:DinB superfamily
MDWGGLLIGQLEFYWDVHLWPRLQGLTDEEYFWEPVGACWSLRAVDGRWVLDGAQPEPEPPPVTTISWRMTHIAVGCFAVRSRAFFPESGDLDAGMWDPVHIPRDLPGTAVEALAFLDREYRRWHGNIAALDEEGLRRPLGRKGGPYAKDPMAALIVHINREVMHHGGEVCLLRDLYRAQRGVGAPPDAIASDTVG